MQLLRVKCHNTWKFKNCKANAWAFPLQRGSPYFCSLKHREEQWFPIIFPCGTLCVWLAWQLIWKKPYGGQRVASVTCLYYMWLNMGHFLNFKKKGHGLKYVRPVRKHLIYAPPHCIHSLKAQIAMLPLFSQLSSQGAYPALDVSSLLNWENIFITIWRNAKWVLIKTLVNVWNVNVTAPKL